MRAAPVANRGSSASCYIVPGDFNQIYDGVTLWATGSHQTIGIVGRSRTNFDDFSYFQQLTQSYFQTPTEVVPTVFGGVDPGPAYKTQQPSTTNLGEQSEATLDVTRAGSVAPNANLLLVVATSASGGIEADAQYLVQTSPVPAQVMSISYGACESAAVRRGLVGHAVRAGGGGRDFRICVVGRLRSFGVRTRVYHAAFDAGDQPQLHLFFELCNMRRGHGV